MGSIEELVEWEREAAGGVVLEGIEGGDGVGWFKGKERDGGGKRGKGEAGGGVIVGGGWWSGKKWDFKEKERERERKGKERERKAGGEVIVGGIEGVGGVGRDGSFRGTSKSGK